ncbi:MAG: poly-beta-hydroxybutyrate polymerase [Rhodovulum sulfidophilum]|uniref:Poly-beta-hydroxybutyrate polymerase n=1 Tax=Rhodovulum sulfidophilum TaxID=35806 RepID=A0A2W5NNK3_RHOSU|nr:MAG: poly-beta-hydroxybutyrate polymerase [Rhodovulum sulfidophilum]
MTAAPDAPIATGTPDPEPGPPAPHRLGEPSPLIFHLGAALSAYTQALLAAPRADSPRFPWSPACAPEAGALGPDLDQVEIAAEIAARLRATVRGLEIWQAHPYRRDVTEPPALWEAGSARLLDYGAAPEARDPSGPPVLVVPSLINRAYVLDLGPGWSFLRWLAAQGARPLLLDWGDPGPEERGFDLDAYGARRIVPALEIAARLGGAPAALLGYCMGGTLAAGVAARRPDLVGRLATIGAPWDFASTDGIAGGFRAILRGQGAARVETMLDTTGQAFGAVPVSLFQMLFAFVNPIQAAVKFQRLARLDPAGAEATHFVALEDWLADGMPMSAPAARDLLVGWQIRNQTARREWRFLGAPVDPGAIAAPALVFAGRKDTIAPPALADPLARAIPRARLARPATGHVGMVVGSRAQAEVWRPVAEFFAGRDG